MSFLHSIIASIFFTVGVSGLIPYQEIEKAFDTNNEKLLVQYCGEKVMLNVLEKDGVYSRSQAQLVLKNFFSKAPNGDFSYFFKGKESTNDSFCIGEYKARSEDYRISINFKKINNSFIINSLNIDKD